MICGFGIYDGDVGGAYNSNVIYKFWASMIERCYSKKMLINNPSYIGTTVCEEWKYYSNFESWASEKYIYGYQLDKDIILSNSKIYSPDTCSFVPAIINSCILDKKTNTKYPIGVSKITSANGYIRPKSFKSSISLYGKPTYLKAFETVEEAHLCWQKAKVSYINEIIEKYNFLDDKILNGLQRRVDILTEDIKHNRITLTINKV